jgi:hypothetical protein
MIKAVPTRSYSLALIAILSSAGYSTYLHAADPPEAKTIPQLLDEARGGLQGIEMKIRIESESANGRDEFSAFTKVRGHYSVSVVEKPEHLQGARIYTSRDKLWYWKPGQSQPVPVTRQQKLLGPISYGDIVGSEYSGNYEAKLLGEAEVDGRLAWAYGLEAVTVQAPFRYVTYWVAQDNLLGIKAEFHSASGQKVKSATVEYDNRVLIDGKTQPFVSKITFCDELSSRDRVTVYFVDPIVKEIPDDAFTIKSTP